MLSTGTGSLSGSGVFGYFSCHPGRTGNVRTKVACETASGRAVVVDQFEVQRVREQRASEGVFSLAGGEVPITQTLGSILCAVGVDGAFVHELGAQAILPRRRQLLRRTEPGRVTKQTRRPPHTPAARSPKRRPAT